MKIMCFAASLLVLAACAAPEAPLADGEVDPFDLQDPIKPFNKAMFDFNLAADRTIIKPVADTYHHVPNTVRGSISNFLSNLGEPANAVNGLLQLNPQATLASFWRFTLNSTFGFAGLRDFAGENGLKNNDTNFGETLESYGMADGAYVVLPLAGPSTVRNTAGFVVDWFLDPVGWVLTTPESIAQAGSDAISTRDEEDAIINQFYYQSIEPYTATRAAYLQHQAFQ